MELFYSIALAIVGVIIGSTALGVISLAPWVPSRKKDLSRIFALADLKPDETFYDLGCGTGQLVIYANQHFKCKAIGIEIGLPMYLICRFKKLFKNNKNIIFNWKNLFKQNLTDADVIYLFGLPGTLKEKLTNKLKRELKPGSRVLSYAFPINGWPVIKTNGDGQKQVKIYLYHI